MKKISEPVILLLSYALFISFFSNKSYENSHN